MAPLRARHRAERARIARRLPALEPAWAGVPLGRGRLLPRAVSRSRRRPRAARPPEERRRRLGGGRRRHHDLHRARAARVGLRRSSRGRRLGAQPRRARAQRRLSRRRRAPARDVRATRPRRGADGACAPPRRRIAHPLPRRRHRVGRLQPDRLGAGPGRRPSARSVRARRLRVDGRGGSPPLDARGGRAELRAAAPPQPGPDRAPHRDLARRPRDPARRGSPAPDRRRRRHRARLGRPLRPRREPDGAAPPPGRAADAAAPRARTLRRAHRGVEPPLLGGGAVAPTRGGAAGAGAADGGHARAGRVQGVRRPAR